MCRPLRCFDGSVLGSVWEVLRAIDRELAELAEIAGETDFDDPAHAEQFVRNVAFLKTYYERAEVLIRERAQPATGGAVDLGPAPESG